MRRILSFECNGATLAATLDEAPGTTGLLIVSGGNEIRIGAHRGMAKLAADVAAAGYPVFRFDRRGVGDSEGQNGGFLSSGPDIEASIVAFQAACPTLTKLVGFGNCDAATALVLHKPDIARMVLANPWVIEPIDELPPSAAIRSHYARRLRDPQAWLSLLRGKLNFGKAIKGIGRAASAPAAGALAEAFAKALLPRLADTTIILAERDNTAIAFEQAWQGPAFKEHRPYQDIDFIKLDSGSHSFASEADYAALKATLITALSGQ